LAESPSHLCAFNNGSDSDDLIRSVKQWQAKQESKDLSKVTFRGLISRASGGWWNGGVPPYGFDREYVDSSDKAYQRVRFNADRSKLVSDLATGSTRLLPRGESLSVSKKDRCRLVLSALDRVCLAHRIAGMYVNHEMGFRTIAEALNREEIPSPNGKGWTVGTIRSIIENPIYTGRMVYNRRASGTFHRIQGGHAIKRDDSEFGKFLHCSQDDWIVVENAHPAIIEDATFQRAQELLRERSRKHGAAAFRFGRAKASPYLLSGLICCLHCGHKYHGRCTAKGKRRVDGTRAKTYYYACNSYVNGKRAECPGSMFRRDALEGDVLARVRRRVEAILENGGRDNLRSSIVKELHAGQPDTDGEVSGIRTNLREIEGKIDNLLESLTPINKEYVDRKLISLGQEKEALESRLKELESVTRQEVDCDAVADEIMAAVSGFDCLFEHGTIQERKEFVGLCLQRRSNWIPTGEWGRSI
jgi:hypothetical protein